MLRLLVIALLLANALLLGVQMLRPSEDGLPRQPASSPSALAVPPLVLLREMGEDETAMRGNAECFTVGPFESEDAKEAARAQIAPSAVAISLRETIATVDRGTWVYLPAQPDYLTARSMQLTLRDAGFADAVVVREGEWLNSVSIGYFLNENNAQAIFDDARSMGFPVERRRQQNPEQRYWLDYEQRVGAPYVQPSDNSPISPDRHRLTACGRGA